MSIEKTEMPHKPFTFIDDGVAYCGWDGHDGCGEVWPCSTVRNRGAEETHCECFTCWLCPHDAKFYCNACAEETEMPSPLDKAASDAYALGDHLHPWPNAGPEMQDEYRRAVSALLSDEEAMVEVMVRDRWEERTGVRYDVEPPPDAIERALREDMGDLWRKQRAHLLGERT